MNALQHYLDSIGVTVDTTPQYGVDKPKWAQNMDAYECILKRNGDRMFAVPFYQGAVHTQSPTTEDVLHALLSDRGTLQYANEFEDWASGLGYNADSISDKKLFDSITEQTHKLELHFTEQELSILSALTEEM